MSGGDDIPFVHLVEPSYLLPDEGLWVPCDGPNLVRIEGDHLVCSDCGHAVIGVEE